VNGGYRTCSLEQRIVVPLNVGRAITETAYIPIRATIPYELAKSTLASDEPMRCSDYMEPLILNYPLLLRPHFEKVEFKNEK